jgi:diamine N-acetyltransferase
MGLRTVLEAIDPALWTDGCVRIKPIRTETELIYAGCECRLADEQKDLVNPAWFSIGRAYLSKEDNYPCLIYNEREEPVGFINLCKWLGAGEAYSWSFYIDRDHQGNGYGRNAAQLAIRILKAAAPSKPIKLAAEKENERAQRLYLSLGFRRLPETDGDDVVFGR